MQDEVHRFAISFHKDKRSKAFISSIYEGVNGLGSKRIELLNKTYPDINALKEATLDELAQIITYKVAVELYEKLHKN